MKVYIENSSYNNFYSKDDSITFRLKLKNQKTFKALTIYLDDHQVLKVTRNVKKITVPLQKTVIGINTIKLNLIGQFDSVQLRQDVEIIPEKAPEVLDYKVVASYPHSSTDYTQGLIISGDTITESTGGYGSSVLKMYNYKTGEVYHEHVLDSKYFGEGITRYKGRIYQLTYKENKLFVYEPSNLSIVEERFWPYEGWGITHNDEFLIISDGSSFLYYLDPESFETIRTVKVYDHQGTVKNINELEFIDGYLYANIWRKDEIVVIDPEDGSVVKKLDFHELAKVYGKDLVFDNVLNGIAYDQANSRLMITGKRWPKLFEIVIIRD